MIMQKDYRLKILYAANIPDESQRYCAYIENSEEYGSIVVSGGSVSECFKEIAISMEVIEKYLASKNNF